MKKLLPFLFAALLLGSGCAKSSPDPAPAVDLLLGRWTVASEVRTTYTSTGAVANTTSTTAAGTIVTMTATQYVANTGSFAPIMEDYTRTGNTLHIGPGTTPSDYVTIAELTATRMVLDPGQWVQLPQGQPILPCPR